MRYGLLGRTGLRVSELFLGAMTHDSPEALRQMVDLYADAGGNVIDTASAWVVARANTLAEWRGWSPFVGLQVPYSSCGVTWGASCSRWPRRSG